MESVIVSTLGGVAGVICSFFVVLIIAQFNTESPPVIEANLIAAGVPAVSEVEIVSDISTDRQRIATCQLGALAATIRAEAIGNPAIILIRHDKGAARLGGTADLQSRDVGKAGKATLLADF